MKFSFTMKRTLFFFILCFMLKLHVIAEVRLPHIFSDNMVFQQNQSIRIWGWADKKESVEIRFLDQVKKVKADKDGSWQVELSPVLYGGPYELNVKGKDNAICLKNILVGEVWLCSGQSNMEWVVGNVRDAQIEIGNADYPLIRSFNVSKDMSMKPKDDLNGVWTVCSPQTVSDYSAVAYFFARKLYQELNVPIGIINSSWGGTDIESWTSAAMFEQLPASFRARYKGVDAENYDQFAREIEQRKAAYEKALTQDPGDVERWYADNYDDSSWKYVSVPGLWKNELIAVDGTVWSRFEVDLPDSAEGKEATLYLGPIDDNDVTYVNGVKVGSTEGHTVERCYNIPAQLLKAGKNSVTVKIIDTGGDGGLYGKADDVCLEIEAKRYSLAGEWRYKTGVTKNEFNYMDISPNMYYATLFNSMIRPITPFRIKGTIWYQGENNAANAYNYRSMFPALINDWRAQWGYEFPFYWVQLANFMAKDEEPQESQWAELREAQTMTLTLPKTGQAVITDIGQADDIHPRNKQDVGLRLALNALNKDYGKKNLVCVGPTYKSMRVDGHKIIISYDHIGSGLVVKNKYGYIEGFTIAGSTGEYHWAKAYLDGSCVIVYSDEVTDPVHVRYAWSNNPDVNLYNREGLPAVPFRTDSRRGITQYD